MLTIPTHDIIYLYYCILYGLYSIKNWFGLFFIQCKNKQILTPLTTFQLSEF